MCLIIDNDVLMTIFVSDDPDYAHIRLHLFGNKSPAIRLVWGGKLIEEYVQQASLMPLVRRLDQMGRLRTVPAAAIDAEMDLLKRDGRCTSNDLHILGLGRSGGVRLLCTRDGRLEQDWCNLSLLPGRGKVYKNSTHRHLIVGMCKNSARSLSPSRAKRAR